MSKTSKELTPLEALNIIIHQFSVDDFPLLQYTRIIEKELKENERLKEDIKKCSCWKEHKALEIIKKHIKINAYRIFSDGYEWELTQEEYELLKEVLL